MLTGLSLRLRIFLFFCLLAGGGVLVSVGALWLGYHRLNTSSATDAFIFSGLLTVFGLLALLAGVWLLFDENVAKPIQRLSGEMRSRAHAEVRTGVDLHAARYLGDLAPAAMGLAEQLSDATLNTAETLAAETARLNDEKERLTALLTDVPVAMILATVRHQIVLYDGQAAEILTQVAHPRLNASLFDYFARGALESAYDRMVRSGVEVSCTLTGTRGAQSHSARMKPLGDAAGYMLIFDIGTNRIPPEAARPLVYDFELLDGSDDKALDACAISDLCFTVFDTETTGLLPHKDEIVQIGAVRVLRGRIVAGEQLDLLVNPGRPIPPASTRVHGVTDAMVADAPDIVEAGQHFHHFARDAVIVAHNAPFDMAFLRNHAKRMDVTWDQPILDTVLLSAVLFGTNENHTLDTLCERLGVEIPPASRHTALGDAIATARALVRILPMLEARGMKTFGDVIAETRKHGLLLEDLN